MQREEKWVMGTMALVAVVAIAWAATRPVPDVAAPVASPVAPLPAAEPQVASPASPADSAPVVPETPAPDTDASEPEAQRQVAAIMLGPKAPAATPGVRSRPPSELLPELVQALEADILAGDQFHGRAALRAINDANFEDTVSALVYQAGNDPGAQQLAMDMMARMQRQHEEAGVAGRVDRVACGLRLCVTEETLPEGARSAHALGVGSGQGWQLPDGTFRHRTVYAVERAIPHAAAPRKE